jgi:bacteriocin/lantibiotic ABC transporter
MERSADLQAQLVESLDLIGTIRRFGIEDFTNVKTENRFIAMLRSIFAAAKGGLYVSGGIQIVEQSMVIAILWIGSSQVIDQNITPGTLMMFYSLVGYVTTPISSLISSNSTIQEALIVSDRLFQIMDLEQEEINNDKITLSTDMIGDICFDNVTFRYGSRKFVFDNFNLTIQKGRTTAVVDESDSGKTTLISLLQNIYPIQSGKIKIGDYDIGRIANKSL